MGLGPGVGVLVTSVVGVRVIRVDVGRMIVWVTAGSGSVALIDLAGSWQAGMNTAASKKYTRRSQWLPRWLRIEIKALFPFS